MSRKPLQDDCRRSGPGLNSHMFVLSSRKSSSTCMISSFLENETFFDDELRGVAGVATELGREVKVELDREFRVRDCEREWDIDAERVCERARGRIDVSLWTRRGGVDAKSSANVQRGGT
jgi:hypothetical protein